jgi:hypothetical protein
VLNGEKRNNCFYNLRLTDYNKHCHTSCPELFQGNLYNMPVSRVRKFGDGGKEPFYVDLCGRRRPAHAGSGRVLALKGAAHEATGA